MAIVGYIFGAIVIFGFGKALIRIASAHMRRKKRAFDDATAATLKSVSEGATRGPTWSRDRARAESFLGLVESELKESDPPGKQTAAFISHPEVQKIALTSAFHFEAKGFSFPGQVVGTVDLLKMLIARGLIAELAKAGDPHEQTVGTPPTPTPRRPARKRETSFEIGGVRCPVLESEPDTIREVIHRLAMKLRSLCPTERQLYCYLMEECGRLSNGDVEEQFVAESTGFFPLEHGGDRDRSAFHEGYRDAIEWLDSEVTPALNHRFGEASARHCRAHLLPAFLMQHEKLILELRLKYAVHFHNTCMGNGHYTYVDRWGEIIDAIEAELEKNERAA